MFLCPDKEMSSFQESFQCLCVLVKEVSLFQESFQCLCVLVKEVSLFQIVPLLFTCCFIVLFRKMKVQVC